MATLKDKYGEENLSAAVSYFADEVDDKLYHCNYQVKSCAWDDEGNIDLSVECIEAESDKFPTLELHHVVYDDGMWGLSPVLTFPTLDQAELDYSDSMAYWVARWADVANSLRSIIEYTFDIDVFLSEREDEM